MSLFQCDKCGCLENTACTSCYMGSYMMNSDFAEPLNTSKNTMHALASYKKILGLKTNEPFGHYCSACCPIWYTEKGEYGIGPNPNKGAGRPSRGQGGGKWHGEFSRTFLPKGQFETNEVGNLVHKVTRQDAHKFKLEKEEGT